MRKISPVLGALVLVACGADPESEGAAGDPMARVTQDARQLIESATEAVSAAAEDEARRCLALVEGEDHAGAVPVCRRAMGMDPRNAQVGAALEAATEKARDGAIERCLDLVQRRAFEEATGPCNDALGMAPENEEVKAALELSRRQAFQLAKEESEEAAAAEEAEPAAD